MTRADPSPFWVHALVGMSTVYQLAGGLALLLFPTLVERQLDLGGGDLSTWQAVGLFQATLGLVLVVAVWRPARNRSLVLAALVAKLVGVAALLLLVPTGDVALRGAAVLGGAELVCAALLWLAWRRVQQDRQAAAVPVRARASAGSSTSATTTTLSGLQQSLQALAAPASVQLSLFPELVTDGTAAAAEFRSWRERAFGATSSLSGVQNDSLRRLDECLEAMLHAEGTELWTAAAVRDSREWGELRAAARRALVAFAWSVDIPVGVVRRRIAEKTPSVDLRRPG